MMTLGKRLRSQGNHQVPDEEGSVFVCRCWQCCYERGRTCPECPSRHELPSFIAEEALAEREVFAHQVHYGTSSEALLRHKLSPTVHLRIKMEPSKKKKKKKKRTPKKKKKKKKKKS